MYLKSILRHIDCSSSFLTKIVQCNNILDKGADFGYSYYRSLIADLRKSSLNGKPLLLLDTTFTLIQSIYLELSNQLSILN